MEVHGRRFDRSADEDVEGFRQRVLESIGCRRPDVMVVYYVDSDGISGPEFPPNVGVGDLSSDQNKAAVDALNSVGCF
jgi:hypothetical protein